MFMPDSAAVNMLDTTGKLRPALSATQDLPAVIDPPKTPDPAPTADQTAVVIERPKEVTVEAGQKADETKVETKTEVVEDADDVLKKDTTPAWMKAEITKARNRQRAADKEKAEALTREAAANERASTLAKALEQATQKPPEPVRVEPEEPRPKRDAFTDPEAYDEALTSWASKRASTVAVAQAEQRFKDDQAKKDKEAQDKRASDALSQIAQEWSTKRNKATEKYSDYAEVAEAKDLQVTPVMAQAIFQIMDGPEVAYHLGKNPDLATRISQLNPLQQVVEIGKISAALAAPPKVEVTRASEPITPIRSSSSAVVTDEREPTMEEYAARRTPQILAQRKGFIPSTRAANS